MMNYSNLVQFWLSLHSVPSAVVPVVAVLEKKGIKVCRVGMENSKAPSHHVFVDHPFDPKEVLSEVHDRTGLSADTDGIGSIEYVWIGFEAGVCPLG
jgi:hypothetical protein